MKLVQANVTRVFSGFRKDRGGGHRQQAAIEAMNILQKGEGFKVFIDSDGVWRADGPSRTVSRRVGEVVQIWQFD